MTVATDLLSDVRDALNMTATTDDAELLRLLDGAVAEYAEYVGDLPGSQQIRVSGGGSMTLLPRGTTEVTAAAYADGSTVDLADYDLDVSTAILHGAFSHGTRNVVLTVTVGALPANHAEIIVADVAELWTRTQRSGAGQRPQFGADGFDPEPGRPIVMFPRIRSLARPGIA